WRGTSASEAETETSPGVLFASGYIAGGTLCGLLLGFIFMAVAPETLNFGSALGLSENMAKIVAVIGFAVLAVILVRVGTQKTPEPELPPPNTAIRPGRP